MNNKISIKLKKINLSVLLYILLFAIFICFLFIGSKYAFSTKPDMFDRAFGKTWLSLMETNYFKFNGRWGQGISNDFRFFEYRTFTILFINLFLLYGSFYFIKCFTDTKNAIILSIATTITFSLVVYNYYYHAVYLPTANSYTIGFSLSLICFALILKMLEAKSKKQKNIYFLFSSLIIVLTSGLVELVSLSIMYALGVGLLFYLVFYKKINLRLVSLFLISVAGFLILFFSPGNSFRRTYEKNNRITETVIQDVNSKADKIQEFISRNERILTDNFNLFNLTLFCLALLIFLKISKRNYKLDIKKSSFIILFTIIYVVIPNFIGFLASYTGMAKIYNMHSIHFVIGVIVLAFIIASSFSKRKNNNNPIFTTLIYSIPFLVFSYFFTQNNNLGSFFNSISTNQMQELYVQEKARRYYLIENKDKNIKLDIPAFQEKYNTVITMNNILNKRMPGAYESTFNNRKPVFSKLIGVSPNIFYALYCVKEQNVLPSKKYQNKHFYFIKDFNCILLGSQTTSQDFNFIIKAYYKTPFKSLTKTIYGSYHEQMLDNKEYYKNKDLVGVDLPFNTYKIEIITDNDKAIVIDNPIQLDYSKIQKFEENNVFSIMN